jgi:site-specific DNA-adenine methylase
MNRLGGNLKPIIKWVGGKYKLSKILEDLLPDYVKKTKRN